ncbi:unnamed protein product [Ambrosiozyma monospora]|uniref:Unnamed protein product n=1 Tax=Ambrosiozyma monospora TaxID=43982 RepID=A0ACB5TV86_AMBMO|nr:unnamed protein product [Ambrosiozyma monospora]
MIPANDLRVMKAAAEALALLATPNGSYTQDFVLAEVKKALEYLVDKSDNKRHAAVLVLSAYAERAPTMVSRFISNIIPNLKFALKDNKITLREDAAICLRYCLRIVYARDIQVRDYWFNYLFDEASIVFTNENVSKGANDSVTNNNPPEYIHGGILCYRELVLQGGPILKSKYKIIFDRLNGVKDHRSVEVRREVAVLMPYMARYDPVQFSSSNMHIILLYYMGQLSAGKDQAFIYMSIADIATEVKQSITKLLTSPLWESIRDILTSKSPKVKRELISAAFYCLAKLALAIGPALTKYINNFQLLKYILKSPITDNMLGLLKVLIDNLPSLEAIINDKLINTISYCFSGYGFKHPGSPDYRELMDPGLAFDYRQRMLGRDGDSSLFNSSPSNCDVSSLANLPRTNVYEDSDVTLILQALKALSFFDFDNYVLTEFVRYCITCYITHENAEVRLKAALSSASIYAKSGLAYQKSTHSVRNVNEVLMKLLTMCVTDALPEIRLEVLKSLNEGFDPQLSQADNVRMLLLTIDDENFEVRKTAIKICEFT